MIRIAAVILFVAQVSGCGPEAEPAHSTTMGDTMRVTLSSHSYASEGIRVLEEGPPWFEVISSDNENTGDLRLSAFFLRGQFIDIIAGEGNTICVTPGSFDDLGEALAQGATCTPVPRPAEVYASLWGTSCPCDLEPGGAFVLQASGTRVLGLLQSIEVDEDPVPMADRVATIDLELVPIR